MRAILGTVRYAENEASIISDFSSYQDMLQPNFTEEEIAHIYQLFMEHPSETVKKIACCLFESAAIASSRNCPHRMSHRR